MAKDGLHPLEIRVLAELDLPAHLCRQLARFSVHFGIDVGLEKLLA